LQFARGIGTRQRGVQKQAEYEVETEPAEDLILGVPISKPTILFTEGER